MPQFYWDLKISNSFIYSIQILTVIGDSVHGLDLLHNFDSTPKSKTDENNYNASTVSQWNTSTRLKMIEKASLMSQISLINGPKLNLTQ